MKITATNIENNQLWFLVDDQNHSVSDQFLTADKKITATIQGPFLHLYLHSEKPGQQNKILIDLNKIDQKLEKIYVDGQTYEAFIETKDINEALSDFINHSVQLAHVK